MVNPADHLGRDLEAPPAEVAPNSPEADPKGQDRSYLSGIFQLHGTVVLELASDGSLMRLGSAWRAFTGHSVADAIGRELTDFVRNEQSAVVAKRIRDAFETGKAGLTFDFDLKTADKGRRWARLQLLALSEDRSRLLAALCDNSSLSVAAGMSGGLPGHDHLTGLPNRMLFFDRLQSIIGEAWATGAMLTVLSIDLDGFRRVNDKFGHAVGDELLKAVAQRLVRLVRSEDLVARVGNDEFVVVQLGPKSPDDAVQLAQRLGRSLKQRFLLFGRDVAASASVGVALFPWDSSSPEDLVRKSEMALVEAKRIGGGADRFFDSEVEARIARFRWVEEELFRSFELRQFEVHFQPCHDLHTERIVGAEALVRWRHPERGMISPAEFVPIAESCGFIRLLGPWVLRQACRAIRQWEEDGLPSIVVAVNVSAVQFQGDAVRDTVESCLTEFDLRPDRLELELTETAMLDGASPGVRDQLADLSRLGIRLAIDDFGTGYGSLTHLRELPLTKIKIDKRFIQGAVDDPGAAAIVHAVGALGGGLGLSIHAEGIETAEQFALAREAGCTEGQGYYFSPAVPEEEFRALLEQFREAAGPRATASPETGLRGVGPPDSGPGG